MIARDKENRARWRRSSRSGGGENCIEIAAGNPLSAVRDSKNPTGPTVRVDLAALLATVKRGRFDLDRAE